MHVRRIPRCCLLKLQDSRFRIIYECCLLHIFDSFSLFLCSICTIAPNISTVNRWVLIFWDFFANLDFTRFATLFLPYNHHFFLVWHHFDTNFLFLVSANCYAFQPCDFTLNSGHLTYMVIYVHCYIYVSVSHNILKNL